MIEKELLWGVLFVWLIVCLFVTAKASLELMIPLPLPLECWVTGVHIHAQLEKELILKKTIKSKITDI
jgi:hypothetical protein